MSRDVAFSATYNKKMHSMSLPHVYIKKKTYVVNTHLNCLDKSRQFKLVPATYVFIKTRNSPNGYVATASGVQETELNTQTKHCSAKREKVKVSNGR